MRSALAALVRLKDSFWNPACYYSVRLSPADVRGPGCGYERIG
jgi:hypothetical protein